MALSSASAFVARGLLGRAAAAISTGASSGARDLSTGGLLDAVKEKIPAEQVRLLHTALWRSVGQTSCV